MLDECRSYLDGCAWVEGRDRAMLRQLHRCHRVCADGAAITSVFFVERQPRESEVADGHPEVP